MKQLFRSMAMIIAAGGLSISFHFAADRSRIEPQTPDEKAWGLPSIELEGNLARIFTISRCEWISGMTCQILYNGSSALPAWVYLAEFDAKGKPLAAKTHLIYPKLNPGEAGKATFRLHSNSPARIVLTADWNGPWRDPY